MNAVNTTSFLSEVKAAYSNYDRSYDWVLSNISKLRDDFKEMGDNRSGLFTKYYPVIRFKLQQVYNSLMDLHDLALNTTIGYYRKYHGPYREELGAGLFNDVKREFLDIFESFLTKLKTLIDIFIKFAFEVGNYSGTSKKNVDSYESLLKVETKKTDKENAERWNVISSSKLFEEFLQNKSSIDEVKNYRDYFIHHGSIDLTIETKMLEGFVHFNYRMPIIRKTGKDHMILIIGIL